MEQESMTEPIVDDLVEQNAAITRTDSWPTGERNAGPDEYGINYDDTLLSGDEVLELLSALIEAAEGPGFCISSTKNSGEDNMYDVNVLVYCHPLSGLITRVIGGSSTVTSYGLSYGPDDPWGTGEPLSENALEQIETWFEVDNDDYDAVLDDLEQEVSTVEGIDSASVTLEVFNADSDHCHIGITYTSSE